MRDAMARAEVGDDQYGEDPSVNSLQDRVSSILGKPAALWVPTGTMANQIALRVMTRPGDDVIVSRESHAVWHESGAGAANSGVQFTDIGTRGVFTRDEFLAARKPRGHLLYPPTSLVEIENTHNRAGGAIFPQDEAVRIGHAAREHGVGSYLDGARLWNAAIESGRDLSQLSAPFDLVSVAFSKGLGAPGGSVLAGSRDLITRATRARRMLGGAMRQAGVFAAACHYALDHHLDRLAEDHANARRLAETLAGSRRVQLDLASTRTNIVVFHLAPGGPDAASVVTRARERGVLVIVFGPRTVRAVTHLDVSAADCDRASVILREVVEAGTASTV